MSSTVKGFNIRDLTAHGRPQVGRINVNLAKALPLTASAQNLFTVAGTILVTGLYGVVTTAASAAIKPTLGITGSAAALAAGPAAGFTGAAGNVVTLPSALGGVLPAPISASESASGAVLFVVSNTIITVTTDVTITGGALTWILTWESLYPKNQAATVTND